MPPRPERNRLTFGRVVRTGDRNDRNSRQTNNENIADTRGNTGGSNTANRFDIFRNLVNDSHDSHDPGIWESSQQHDFSPIARQRRERHDDEEANRAHEPNIPDSREDNLNEEAETPHTIAAPVNRGIDENWENASTQTHQSELSLMSVSTWGRASVELPTGEPYERAREQRQHLDLEELFASTKDILPSPWKKLDLMEHHNLLDDTAKTWLHHGWNDICLMYEQQNIPEVEEANYLTNMLIDAEIKLRKERDQESIKNKELIQECIHAFLNDEKCESIRDILKSEYHSFSVFTKSKIDRRREEVNKVMINTIQTGLEKNPIAFERRFDTYTKEYARILSFYMHSITGTVVHRLEKIGYKYSSVFGPQIELSKIQNAMKILNYDISKIEEDIKNIQEEIKEIKNTIHTKNSQLEKKDLKIRQSNLMRDMSDKIGESQVKLNQYKEKNSNTILNIRNYTKVFLLY